MKKSNCVKHLLACLAVILSGNSQSSAKFDGSYLNKVSMEYETPHLKWGENMTQKPLRTLFIIPNTEAREVVEFAQRMKIDFGAFITPDWMTIGSDDVYAAALTGASVADKTKELRTKLRNDYDLIVLSSFSMTKLPEDCQFAILEKIRNGSGLLMLNTRMPLGYKKPLAKKISTPAELLQELDIVEPAKNIQAYEFEKGRILAIDPAVFPECDKDNRWTAKSESMMALYLRGMLWAGGKSPEILFECPELLAAPTISAGGGEFAFTVSGKDAGSCSLDVRIRDEFNKIVATPTTGAKAAYKLKIPALPPGGYFADVFVKQDGKTANFGSYRFQVASPLGKVSLEAPGASIEDKAPFGGKIKWEKPSAEELTLELSLADAPYERIWTKKSIKVPANSMEIDWTLDSYYIPTIAGMLGAELRDPSGKVVGRADQAVFFPNRKIEDYFTFAWGIPLKRSAVAQNDKSFGFSAGLAFPHNAPRQRNHALLNQRIIPYMITLALVKSKTGGVRWGGEWFLYSEEDQAEAKRLRDDSCFYRPEVMKLYQTGIQKGMRHVPKYGPPVYSLGDENNLDTSAGYGPSDEQYFREFLTGKYKDVAALNKAWKTEYPGFDAVPHIPMAEALKAGNYPAWNDHQEYIEKMYADMHHFCAAEIKKIDPKAKVGSEGSMPGDLELTSSKMEFWGPYRDLLGDEAMRSFGKDKLRTVWYGYHNERGPGKSPILLQDLLKGIINGMGWFELDQYGASCILTVDDRPSFDANFIKLLNNARFGIGQLLVNTPLTDDGVRVFWSHLSQRAPQIDKKLVSPTDSVPALIRSFYQSGINFEMVSDRTLDRLRDGKSKILFLLGDSVLTDAAAAAVSDFVEKGGTVVSDMNCGVLNGVMGVNAKNPLAALFGDMTMEKLEQPAIGRVAIDKEINGVKIQFQAEKARAGKSNELFQVRELGKGRAILLNFTLQMAETTAAKETPFNKFVLDLLKVAGVESRHTVSLPDSSGIVRFRTGKGFELVGAHVSDSTVKAKGKGEILLPSERFIYACGVGFVGKTNKISLDFSASPLELFSLFESKQAAPEVSVARKSKLGSAAEFDLSAIPDGRTLLIEVFAPGKEKQKPWPERNAVVDTGKTRKHPFHFAYNDAPGTYRFVITDMVTGLKTEKTISVD